MVTGHTKIPMIVVMIILITLLRGNCALECMDGQYQSGDACRECKSTCAKCISEFLCTKCKVGFFGEACTENCSVSCFERRCVKKTGNCMSCDKGYYVKNVRCEKCPEKCTECLNAGTCTNCVTGYTGSICENLCVNCKPNSGCSEEGTCIDGCKDGYSGLSCLQHCSSNCLSCDRVDAKKCNSCAKGKYGSNCEKLCSTKCIDNFCSKETRACTHGCQNGFWGDQCEYVCPVNCRDGKCFRSSGICVDGCNGNFTGTKCLCPRTCDCDTNGTCINCGDNTGFVCDKQCSSMCEYNLCLSGMERKCFYGCRDGYIGSLCSPVLTDLETEVGKSYVTIIVTVILVVLVAIILVCVRVFIIRRKAWLSGRKQLATVESHEEGYSRVATEMCYQVSSRVTELPPNIGKQYRDQYKMPTKLPTASDKPGSSRSSGEENKPLLGVDNLKPVTKTRRSADSELDSKESAKPVKPIDNKVGEVTKTAESSILKKKPGRPGFERGGDSNKTKNGVPEQKTEEKEGSSRKPAVIPKPGVLGSNTWLKKSADTKPETPEENHSKKTSDSSKDEDKRSSREVMLV